MRVRVVVRGSVRPTLLAHLVEEQRWRGKHQLELCTYRTVATLLPGASDPGRHRPSWGTNRGPAGQRVKAYWDLTAGRSTQDFAVTSSNCSACFRPAGNVAPAPGGAVR